ncbi:MAG: GAF domain-containing protein [Solirubrobacteraceae bacterium]
MDNVTREVLNASRTVLEELDLDTVLRRVLEAASRLTHAQYAALGVLDESRSELSRFLTVGVDGETRQLIGALPTGRGVLGELIRDPVPLRLRDLGAHPYSYGFPAGHPPMRSFLGVPIFVEGQPFGNLYLTEKQGAAEFTIEDEQAVVVLAEFAGVAIGHAQRFSFAADRLTEHERRLGALDATIQIARALGGETDLTAILELVAKRGRALVSARIVLIELLRIDELEIAAGAGEIPAGVIGMRLGLQNTVASAALRTRRTQNLADDVNRARFEQHGLGRVLAVNEALVVPLLFRDQAYGALVAIDQLDAGAFTEEQQQLLEAFAASAATAVATAQSMADERRVQRLAAAEAERSRWARELHDDTLEGLASIRVMLATAERGGQREAMAAAIRETLDQLETELSNLRALITDLRPAALDELGLEPAVYALVERATRRGLQVDVRVDLAYEQRREPDRHTSELETAQYRILQEALNNAIKHGSAQRVVVRIEERGPTVSLTVQDDGRGFDASEHVSGLGLLGMRERAELLDGTLHIDSKPGAGTKITAVLPVRRRGLEEAADNSVGDASA